MSRWQHQETLLGASNGKILRDAKVLVIGAGGIGCEVLKNLVMSGFKNIDIVDLDTIELSNLNRQFLFRREHISKPKSFIAREAVLQFNPDVTITSYHANIKDEKFNPEYFRQFDVVLDALDNLDARRHVNRLCLTVNVPLVESGTAGYFGQCTIINKDLSECFECQPKSPPKTFPTCTIRNTPSAPIHCVVWAKEYLFSHLFGPSNEESSVLNNNNDDLTNEIVKRLEEETSALKALRRRMNKDSEFVGEIFDRVFHHDILRLKGMKDLWENRSEPTPLLYQQIQESLVSTSEEEQGPHISYHRIPTLEETFEMFRFSILALAKKRTETDEEIIFDKDEKICQLFVSASSNLRAHIFGIERKSVFDITSMAGNIIPAVATANSIIAGMIVLNAIKIITGNIKECKTTYLTYGGRRKQLFVSEKLAVPNKSCSVCRTLNITLKIDLSNTTLKSFVETVLRQSFSIQQPTITHNERLLYDPEFDDNLNKTMIELMVFHNTVLTISDEDRPGIITLLLSQSSCFPSDCRFELVKEGVPMTSQDSLSLHVESTSANRVHSNNSSKILFDKGSILDDEDLSFTDLPQKRIKIDDTAPLPPSGKSNLKIGM